MKKAVLCVLTLALAACAAVEPTADEHFEALAARYVDESMELSPVGATFTGDHRFDGELDQISPEARARDAYLLVLGKLGVEVDHHVITRVN